MYIMKGLLLLISTIIISLNSIAQIEKVFIETYYISDSNDATDTIGGRLSPGSTTYRIFVDLKKGSKLLGIYGDENHRMKISSDSVFFNNKNGKTFASDFTNVVGEFYNNTVALDTWLALGQVSATGLKKTFFGIPKTSDRNGSFVGGNNNDGGSNTILSGLLSNKDNNAGIPITQSDGIDTMVVSGSETWTTNGFVINPFTEFEQDTTIFGSIKPQKSFESNNCIYKVNGNAVSGVNRDSNQVLIAQLTTRGSISFEINLEVEEVDYNGSSKITKYVAVDNGNLAEDEKANGFLRYPFICGCLDPDYIEYNDMYACNDQSLCKTLKVYGCKDPLACNYDPKANISIPELCCYPGYCNDRDISIVCPALNEIPQVYLYPNPTSGIVTLKIDAVKNKAVSYSIINGNGTTMFDKDLGEISLSVNESIDASTFDAGVYQIKVTIGDKTDTFKLVKQ